MRTKRKMFLWDELDEERKKALLAKDACRVKYTEGRAQKDKAHQQHLKDVKVQPHLSFETIWNEIGGEGGINLRDGWCRIFTLNRFGIFQVNCAVRLEEKWLAQLSKVARDYKEMTVWPRGNLPKSNPWKSPHFTKVVVALPVWHEDVKQLSVTFEEQLPKGDKTLDYLNMRRRRREAREKGKKLVVSNQSSFTVYFGTEIEEDLMKEGMWTPRKQQLGRPWTKADGLTRYARKRVPSFFQPDGYDIGLMKKARSGVYTVLEVKAHLIRKHRRERPDLIPMDIKATIEFWLEAIGLDPHNKK